VVRGYDQVGVNSGCQGERRKVRFHVAPIPGHDAVELAVPFGDVSVNPAEDALVVVNLGEQLQVGGLTVALVQEGK